MALTVFKHAILNNSAYVICFHNHPSGDCDPSAEDRKMTRRMEECGRILDLPLVDHIVLGSQGWFMSFAELGLLENRFEIA